MADRSRLEKLVGMLGSDHENEALNAVRFIRKMAEDDKVTILELLSTTLGKVVEKVVVKERPREEQRDNHPATRPYKAPHREAPRWSGFARSYEGSFDPDREHEPETFSRALLDELREISQHNDLSCLDMGMQDFVSSAPYQYSWDYQLSLQQKKFARVIIKKWKSRNAEPLI